MSKATERFTSRSTALWLYSRCDERCTLTARGTISIGGAAKALRTSKTTLTLRAGARTKVVLGVSRSLRKKIRSAVAHHHRVRVKVRLTVLDAAGNKATRTRSLRLVR